MKDLQQILTLLVPHADVVDSEPLNALRNMDVEFAKNLAAAREQGRNLRIAVIGQMKAGKSSFLNAALFGRDVLPKAETPMTAALTSIVHGSSSRAEVQFYSRADWDEIERKAFDYQDAWQREDARLRGEQVGTFGEPLPPTPAEIERHIDPALKACAELVAKARAHGLDLDAHLGRTEALDGMGDIDQLASALQDYVGSGGRFTAITKMTTLHLDDERLSGLEVVDTPGFNDPVVSRGAITRAHLARCDVIFLLSPLGQFLGAADMRVFREQLPEAGLGDKAVFLVGTQRDLILRQDGTTVADAARGAAQYPPEQRELARLKIMLLLLDRKMTGISRDAFAGQAQRGADARTARLLEELGSKPPHFISSWAWLLADRLDALSGDDLAQLERLQEATGVRFDAPRLKALSNIPSLRDKVLEQRERKRELLAGKEKQLVESHVAAVRRCLEDVRSGLVERRGQITNGSIAELDRLEQDAVARLERGKAKLEDVFDEQSVQARKGFATLKTELKKLSYDYLEVASVRETSTESYRVDTSIFKGFFGHTWETRYRDVATVYASVQDAVEKIDRFAHACIERFQREIAGCVDLGRLRQNVSAAAMALFDTGSADFDGDLMLSGINKSLRRITIPDVDLGDTSFTESITRQFGSGRVSEDSIEALRQAHRAAIEAVVKDIGALVDGKIKEIETSLDRSAATFVADMSRDIAANLRQLREQRADRENALERIAKAQRAVERALAPD